MDLALHLETPRMGHRQVSELTKLLLAKKALKLSVLSENCDKQILFETCCLRAFALRFKT